MIHNRDLLAAEMTGVAHARLSMCDDHITTDPAVQTVLTILDGIYAHDEDTFKRAYNLSRDSCGLEPKFTEVLGEDGIEADRDAKIDTRLLKFARPLKETR